MFVAFELASDDSVYRMDGLDEIVVSSGQIRALALNFEKTWRRPPTKVELEGLIQSYIRDEIFYREARAMGLDENDAVIKRVLRRKLEFVLTDVAQIDNASNEELEAFMRANAEDYRKQSVFSFRQVYLPDDQRDGAAALLEQLRAGDVDPVELDRMALLPYGFEKRTARDVERVFGREFVANLSAVAVGDWQGPIESGFGYHLVQVTERSEGEIPGLDAVRDAVSRDWSTQRRRETNEAFYQTLRKRYSVRIEGRPPEDRGNAGLLEVVAQK